MSLTHSSTARTLPRFITASASREISVLLALSLLFPFMLHLVPVPDDVRLGPRLLPMFYAPLLGALLGRISSAVAVAVIAPWLNYLVTGHPWPRGCVMMNLQLLTFVVLLRWLLARFGPRWFLAAPAYFLCMLVAAAAGALRPELINGAPALAWYLRVVTMGLPGVGIFLLINWLAVTFYPGEGNDSGPVAA